jgi:type IV pilus assembly protein PilA
MRKAIVSLTVLFGSAVTLCGQQPTSSPQTARQALIEMFFSKTPGTFVKHLPSVTRDALEKSGAMANLQQYSNLIRQLQTQGQNVQTFDTGSVLLVAEDPKTGQKAEITVENDALRGDEDDIEVTFHATKRGQEQMSPFMPQIVFAMKQEEQVWKLNEISITLHLPLADPNLLKAITDGVKARANANMTLAAHSETPIQAAGSDAMVLAAMRTILTAEVTYATTYPNVGYTCTLSDLDGFGADQPNEHQAMLINSGLASGRRFGFVFTLSRCAGAPAMRFRLTAVPNGNTFGRKAFCSDQSGVIRSSVDGNGENCLASGVPVQ